MLAAMTTTKRSPGIVATNVKRLREERGYTEEKLEELTGVSRPTISRLLTGVHQPRASTVSALAKALGVSESDLWREPESRHTATADYTLAPGLANYLTRHREDVTPREEKELRKFSFSTEPGYAPDDAFWSSVHASIRRRLAEESGAR